MAGLLPDAGGLPVLDAEDQGLPPLVPPDAQATLDALLRAVNNAAQMASGATDTRETGEAAKAALAFAQAWAILHPQLDPAGLPLDHHLQMEQERGQNAIALEALRGQNQLEAAKEAARAPTPVKSIKVNRDTTGRASSYEQS